MPSAGTCQCYVYVHKYDPGFHFHTRPLIGDQYLLRGRSEQAKLVVDTHHDYVDNADPPISPIHSVMSRCLILLSFFIYHIGRVRRISVALPCLAPQSART